MEETGWYADMLIHLSRVWLFVIPWVVARQAPLPMGFSRQEYYSELPCPPSGDLPDPGIEPASPVALALASKFFTTGAIWEAQNRVNKNPNPLRDASSHKSLVTGK